MLSRRSSERITSLNQMARSSTTRPEAAKPVVAYIKMNLHEDGGWTVLTSDHVKGCANNSQAQRLQKQLAKAHQMHLTTNTEPDRESRRRGLRSKVQTLDEPESDIAESRKRLALLPSDIISSIHHHSPPDIKPEASSSNETNTVSTVCVTTGKRHSFRIEQTDKVTEFLKSRLGHLQQMAVKRLAKSWIKGLCPKKQAISPYHSVGNVPSWWPEDCPYKEPDHIRKEYRSILAVHLLRLRPKHGEMQDWNDDERMPHATYDTGGWTNFLRGVAPAEIIKDLRETDVVNERRAKYVKEIYDIMQMEEDFENDAIDGTDQFFWVEDALDTVIEARSSAALRRAATRCASASPTSIAPRLGKSSMLAIEPPPMTNVPLSQDVGPQVKPSGRTRSPRPAKRRRTDPVDQLSSSKRNESDDETQIPVEQPRRRSRKKATSGADKTATSYEDHVSPTGGTISASTSFTSTSSNDNCAQPLVSTWDSRALPMAPFEEMYDTSFSSAATSFYTINTTDSFTADASRMLPLATNMTVPLSSMSLGHDARAIPAHMATQVPQPFFRTLPNSPILPHVSLLGLPMDHSAAINSSMQPHPWVAGQWPTSFTSTLYDLDNHMPDQGTLLSQPMSRHSSNTFQTWTTPDLRRWETTNNV